MSTIPRIRSAAYAVGRGLGAVQAARAGRIGGWALRQIAGRLMSRLLRGVGR